MVKGMQMQMVQRMRRDFMKIFSTEITTEDLFLHLDYFFTDCLMVFIFLDRRGHSKLNF